MAWVTLVGALALAVLGSLALEPGAPTRAAGSGRVYLPRVAGRQGPTATPTIAAPGDLELTGLVYDASLGPTQGIAGALVAAQSCLGGRVYAVEANAQGRYALRIPADYVNPCTELVLQVSAAGFVTYQRPLPVTALRALPVRDFGLAPVPTVPPPTP
jgi:hypothetical protein